MKGFGMRGMFRDRRGQQGFTLTEVLITMAMVGLLTASMFTLYFNMQRTTYNQEGVVDTQQSLRVAMDAITRDVRMAGFIVPAGLSGIASTSTTASLVTNTASSSYAFARIDGDVPVVGGISPTTDVAFFVADANMLDPFLSEMVTNPGNIKVRIIRPSDGSQPFDGDLTLLKYASAADRDNARTALQLNIHGFNNTSLVNYKSGDMISLVPEGGPDPSTVAWDLNAGNLRRTPDGGTPGVVATGINALQFAYLAADGTAFTTFPLSDEDRANIAAVRVTITAQAAGQMDQVNRFRSMTSVIGLKNF